VKTEATVRKTKRREQAQRQAQDGEFHAVAATIRWALVLPVDFDGDDTSLTQAQLAVLK
jgi:hypothetical protein